MTWVNPELVLRAFISEKFPSTTVSVETPNDLETALPYIRLTMLGGFDDGFTDTADIDVECFARTRAAASTLAEDVRIAVLAAAATNDPKGRLCDSMETVSRPKWVDYRNTKIQRYVATYRMQMRPLS